MSKQERAGGKSSATPPPGVSKVPLGSNAPIWTHPMFVPVVIAVFFYYDARPREGQFFWLDQLMLENLPCFLNIQTVTSVTPNEGEYIPLNGKAALSIKDLPGHERVRIKFWDESKAGSRGIVCVVDASGGNKAIRESAEIIYTVLTDPAVTSVRPNILIFANKQDAPLAKAITVVKTQLERELTTLRMTKSAGLTSIGGGSGSSAKFLGKMDKDFEFAHAAPLKIEFAEGSCNLDKKELTVVTDWLDTIA
ncbi:Signal recognition particle receptor subunit beta [Orchesella cincta]|uniref:Signal recognition particle receptor subunit beta n=1 Tax=Orchesella cincta TaxID=48709 RepID=A0A1D2MQE2_ORCCI|nr:Signal recognition particle receptor subunit beta [Orchesella cincta]